MIKKIRKKISSLRAILAARHRFLSANRISGSGVTIIEGGTFLHILLNLITTRHIQPVRLAFWTRTRLQMEMSKWVRGRLIQSRNEEIFVGDRFKLIIPREFHNSTEIVINDLREVFCENVYSRYLPFSSLVCEGDTVLDCGANIGSFSVWAATRGKDIRVISMEPDWEIGCALRRNIEFNGIADRVHVEQACVSNQPGEVTLLKDLACFTMTRMATNTSAPSSTDSVSVVPVETIDQMVARLKLDRVDLIKMDVEGAERLALRGAAETIRRFRPRLTISAYHLHDDIYVLAELIRNLCPSYDLVVTNNLYIYASTDRSQ